MPPTAPTAHSTLSEPINADEMPSMEICVENLSVSAQAAQVAQEETGIPTVLSALRSMVHLHSTSSVQHKTILRDVSMHVKPRAFTLVLGRPGSGKSTLLKALGGQLPTAVDVDGTITFDGIQQKDLPPNFPHFIGYVGQQDDHFATLTVKETFQFSYEFAGGDSNADEGSSLQLTPDQVIDSLGLSHCQDTILGDAVLRGVSGGERKRVTLGEGLLGRQRVLLLDEISTGLDAATTLDIITLLKQKFVLEQGRTVVVSLLQPAPEVFELFDNVLVLNDGEMLYNGPREAVVDHFAKLGLQCPQDRPVADFLLDIGTSHQAQYENDANGTRPTTKPGHAPQTLQLQELAEAFRHSEVYIDMMKGMADRLALTPSSVETQTPPKSLQLMRESPLFAQSFWRNTLSLTRRQLLIVSRNTAFLRARVVMSIFMGLIYGSVFYQVNPTKIQLVLGMCFQAVIFLLVGQTAQIITFVDARVVLAKQRRAQLTRSSSYVLACCAGQLPAALLETIVFGSLLYWLGGLEFDVSSSSSLAVAGRYFVFEGLLFLTLLASIAWFFVVAAVSADRNVGFPVAMASIIAFNLFAGFVVPKDQFPDWLIWGYWINPLAWALRALVVNSYGSPLLENCTYAGVDYCELSSDVESAGEYYLARFSVPDAQAWIPLAAVYLLFAYAFFMILAWVLLERMSRHHGERASSTTETPPKDVDALDGGYTLALTPRGENTDCSLNISTTATVTPVTLSFQDLWYSVPSQSTAADSTPDSKGSQIDLLKGVSGYAMPGTMTALMGSSGAGKTTLLDVLAGRKSSGSVRGRILLNGELASKLAIRRCTGYCEQLDLHSDGSTIREALLFSALLRQESTVPEHEKRVVVDDCLEMLELQDISDQLIRGRSNEELKRISIGVELAARNSVLFLDEPTSGLDAQAAANVMRTVRRAVDQSQITVVCTIHQPSASVFELFDKLLLLQLGGEAVYFGDSDVDVLRTYFGALPGAKPLPEDYNPASWILECVGAGVTRSSDQGAEFVRHFLSSQHYSTLSKALGNHVLQKDDMVPLNFSSKRAASSWTQMRLLIARFRMLYWRTPSYSLVRVVLALTLGLIIGALFSGADFTSYQGVSAGMGGVFLSLAFTGIVAINSLLPLAVQDRAAFYRERMAQSYNALWYFIGGTLAEIPYVAVSSLIFTVLSFTIMGFTDGGDASWGVATIAAYWFVMALFTLQQVYLGQFLAYALPDVELASLLGTVVSNLFLLFAGFNPPSDAISLGYNWLHIISPARYAFSALTALVFADCPSGGTTPDRFGCHALQDPPLELEGFTVKQYVESVFKTKHDDIIANTAITLAFAVGFQLLGLLALRFISYQRK